MKTFITLNRPKSSLQDLMNNLQNNRWEKREYLKEISKIEQELCLIYDTNFSIKTEETEGKFYSTIYLNNKLLLTFEAKL